MKLHQAVSQETGVKPEYIGFIRHKDALEQSLDFETRNQPVDSKWDYLHSKKAPIRILVVIHKNRILSMHEVKGVKREYPSTEERWDMIKEYNLRDIASPLVGKSVLGWSSQRHSMARYGMTMFDKIEVEVSTLDKYMPEEVADGAYEGAKKTVTVNAYERNSEARAKCIDHYRKIDGTVRCQACEMTFLEKYGAIGKDFIHVHHIVPLHKIGEAYKVDPIKDLVPVCPNCHAMLHMQDPPMKVEDLALRIRK